MKGVWYLAGRMQGIPQMNYPRFAEVATALRKEEIEVINPAEQDSASTQKMALLSKDGNIKDIEMPYGVIISRCIRAVLQDSTGVIAMDDWWRSKGARMEVNAAITVGKPVYTYHHGSLNKEPLTVDYAARLIYEHTGVTT